METTVTPSPHSPARAVVASLLGVLSLLLLAAAGAGLWARYGSSDHGWIHSGTHRYQASGRALVTGSLDGDGIPNWLIGSARVTVSPAGGRPLFVGVARRADVDRYLAGVAHTTLEDVNFSPFRATYSEAAGALVPARPADQAFWQQAKVVSGPQTVSWQLRSGDWRVVVMNAAGSPGVAAEAKAGVSIRNSISIPLAAAAIALALALAAGAAALLRRQGE